MFTIPSLPSHLKLRFFFFFFLWGGGVSSSSGLFVGTRHFSPFFSVLLSPSLFSWRKESIVERDMWELKSGGKRMRGHLSLNFHLVTSPFKPFLPYFFLHIGLSNVKLFMAYGMASSFGEYPRLCLVNQFIRFYQLWPDFGCVLVELLYFSEYHLTFFLCEVFSSNISDCHSNDNLIWRRIMSLIPHVGTNLTRAHVCHPRYSHL